MLQSVILGPKGKLISKCLFGVFENLPQNEKRKDNQPEVS